MVQPARRNDVVHDRHCLAIVLMGDREVTVECCSAHEPFVCIFDQLRERRSLRGALYVQVHGDCYRKEAPRL